MAVHSGVETSRLQGEALCRSVSPPAPVNLVLDAPWGYALVTLRAVPRPLLVVTENPSVHYLRDVLDLKPEGLIAASVSPEEVGQALVRVAKGESLYMGPRLGEDSICPREREVLRLVALGLGNREIAKKLGVCERTVANSISSLRDKLGLKNRVEVALYYLGILPSLRGHEEFTDLE